MLRKNIEETIGAKEKEVFELVFIDNTERKHNIFQAYNIGVRQSKGDILCFMHDDASYITYGWGKIVNEIFIQHKDIGCIGVAGTHFLGNTPASWWHSHYTSMRVLLDNFGQISLAERHENITDRHLANVASIDGLWFCIRKDLFNHISFDEKTYLGFHCYDSDICMQIASLGYTISVTFDILIRHKAVAEVDMSYFFAIKSWQKKWREHLPLIRGICMSDEEINRITGLVCDSVENEEKLVKIKTSKAYLLGKTILEKRRAFLTLFKSSQS